MKRRAFTFIIASGLPVRKFTVPRALLITATVAISVLLLTGTLSSLRYFAMWEKTQNYDDVLVQVDQLRSQNENFRTTAKRLTDRLASLEVSTNKLRIVAGDVEGLGGIGGPTNQPDAILALDEPSLYQHFLSLDRKSISLRGELKKLQDYYKERSILLATTPSLMPVNGYPSDRFGMRRDPFTNKSDFHPGVDISAPRGSRVIATADGMVDFAGRNLGYGKLVELNHHFGVITRYGHLAEINVKQGQQVRKGDIVGYVGQTGRATGPHVHYEIRLNGRALDPFRFLADSD